jgi:DNA-directed RNA polymerase subunit M/transcription elongation factor TFIIS
MRKIPDMTTWLNTRRAREGLPPLRTPHARILTIRVSKHYKEKCTDPDTETTYNVKITKRKDGFDVSGKYSDIESFVDDMTLGDPDEMERILDTISEAKKPKKNIEPEETCPNCDEKFAADAGDYGPPGRIECPSCGADFDAEYDDDYNREMDKQDQEEPLHDAPIKCRSTDIDDKGYCNNCGALVIPEGIMKKTVKLGANQLRSLIISEAKKLNEQDDGDVAGRKDTRVEGLCDLCYEPLNAKGRCDACDEFEEEHPSRPSREDDVDESDTMKCHDCGKRGVRTGHQDCQYPQDHDMDESDDQDDDLDEASGEAYGVGGVHEFASACVGALKKYADLENVQLNLRTEKLWLQMATDFYLKNVDGPKGA